MANHDLSNPDTSRAAHRPLGVGLTIFLAIALFFLWEEHRAHLLGALPWLLLLACPVMHHFMHRGHKSHHHDRTSSSAGNQEHAQDESRHAGHGCC